MNTEPSSPAGLNYSPQLNLPLAELAYKVAEQNQKLTDAVFPLQDVMKKIEDGFRPFREQLEDTSAFEYLKGADRDELQKSPFFRKERPAHRSTEINHELSKRTAEAVEALRTYVQQQALEHIELAREQERIAILRHHEQLRLHHSTARWAKYAFLMSLLAFAMVLVQPLLQKPQPVEVQATVDMKELKPVLERLDRRLKALEASRRTGSARRVRTKTQRVVQKPRAIVPVAEPSEVTDLVPARIDI